MSTNRTPRIVIEDLPALETLNEEELARIYGAGRFRPMLEPLEDRMLMSASAMSNLPVPGTHTAPTVNFTLGANMDLKETIGKSTKDLGSAAGGQLFQGHDAAGHEVVYLAGNGHLYEFTPNSGFGTFTQIGIPNNNEIIQDKSLDLFFKQGGNLFEVTGVPTAGSAGTHLLTSNVQAVYQVRDTAGHPEGYTLKGGQLYQVSRSGLQQVKGLTGVIQTTIDGKGQLYALESNGTLLSVNLTAQATSSSTPKLVASTVVQMVATASGDIVYVDASGNVKQSQSKGWITIGGDGKVAANGSIWFLGTATTDSAGDKTLYQLSNGQLKSVSLTSVAIGSKWLSLGGPSSSLGLPTGAGEQPAPDGLGRVLTFTNGWVIYWASGMMQARAMSQPIYQQWQQQYGGARRMGTPQTDEGTGKGIRSISFANGAIADNGDGTYTGALRDQAGNLMRVATGDSSGKLLTADDWFNGQHTREEFSNAQNGFKFTRYVWDSAGNPVSVDTYDQAGNELSQDIWQGGQHIHTDYSKGQATAQYTWDSAGTPVSGATWDSAGNELSQDTWKGGQHTRSEFANGKETARYVWDSAGNPVAAYTWDTSGKELTSDTWQGGQHTHVDFANGLASAQYVWDSAGTPVSAATWDSAGNELSQDTWTDGQHTHSEYANGKEIVRYVWDSAGNPVAAYTWDSAGHGLSQDTWQGGKHTHSEFANGLETLRYVLDSSDNPIAAYTWSGTTQMSEYHWDSSGNQLSGWSRPSFGLLGGGIISQAKQVGGNLSSGAQQVGGAISSGAKQLGGDISSGAKQLGGDISSGAKQLGGEISSGAKQLGDDISSGAKELGAAIAAGAKHLGGILSTWAKQLGGRLSSWSKQLGGDLATGIAQAKQAGGHFASVMKTEGGKASDSMKAAGAKSSDWMKTEGGKASGWFQKVFGGSDSGMTEQDRRNELKAMGYTDVQADIIEQVLYSGKDIHSTVYGAVYDAYYDVAFAAELLVYASSGQDLTDQAIGTITQYADQSAFKAWLRYYGFNADASPPNGIPGVYLTSVSGPDASDDSAGSGPSTNHNFDPDQPITGSSGVSPSGGSTGGSTGGGNPDGGSSSAGDSGGFQGGGSGSDHVYGGGGKSKYQQSEDDFHQRLVNFTTSADQALNADRKNANSPWLPNLQAIKDWASGKAMEKVKDALAKVMTSDNLEAKVVTTATDVFNKLLESTQEKAMADTLKAHPNAKPVVDFHDLSKLDGFVSHFSGGGVTVQAYEAAQQGYTVWQTASGEWVEENTPGLVLQPGEYQTKLDPKTAQSHKGTATPRPVSDTEVLKDFVKTKLPEIAKDFGLDKLKEWGTDELKDILKDK